MGQSCETTSAWAQPASDRPAQVDQPAVDQPAVDAPKPIDEVSKPGAAKPETAKPETAKAQEVATEQEIQRWILQLSDSNYRVRQRAFWKLRESSEKALPIICEVLDGLNHDAGTRAVDLITEIALSEEVGLRVQAMEVLEYTGQQQTYVGRLAENSLNAISDIQEQQAIEILLQHEARIGPRDFSLNGQLGYSTENALHINEAFTGDEDVVRWIPFVKSVETVCLEGSKINRNMLEAVSRMKGVVNIKLKDVSLEEEDLWLLGRFRNLQHLGLVYVKLKDSAVDILADLPVSSTMKIYGTGISEAAFQELKSQTGDLEFYYGMGGFLGVSPRSAGGTEIARVTGGSAADVAGIRIGDVLNKVGGTEVKTFADLREQLGQYTADESILITLNRGGQEMAVSVLLQKEP
ncbi:MAG: PDZ domain-containing protein [Pirellulaceae bacterium]